MQSLIELVSFKLAAQADEAAFTQLQNTVNEWVKTQPGFYYRTLVKQADGSFLDIVHWASKADAEAAADKIMQQSCMQEMMTYIEPDSVSMHHQLATSEVGAEALTEA